MNRGSSLAAGVRGTRPTGFNEAPIHESGKSFNSNFGSRFALSFNEAPIHESGKFENPGTSKNSSRGFNEAPIHESGKFYGDF